MKLKRSRRRLEPGQTILSGPAQVKPVGSVSCPACGERIPLASVSFHNLYDCSERIPRATLNRTEPGLASSTLRIDQPQAGSVAAGTSPAGRVNEPFLEPTRQCERPAATEPAEPPSIASTSEASGFAEADKRPSLEPKQNAFIILMTPQIHLECYWTLRRIPDPAQMDEVADAHFQCDVVFAGEPAARTLLAEPHWHRLGRSRLPYALWRPDHVRRQVSDLNKVRTEVVWMAHESLSRSPFYESLAQRRGIQEPRLSRSLLLSALQKSIRRGYRRQVVHLSRYLVDHYGLGTLARRLLVITVEDCIVHPAMPILAWYMGATSKAYRPTVADVNAILQYATEISTVPVRDHVLAKRYESVEAFHRDWLCYEHAFKATLSAAARSLVAAMLLRALYGGMLGDQLMLRDYALEWLQRLVPSENDLPPRLQEGSLATRQVPFASKAFVPRTEARVWYRTPAEDPPSPWLAFVEWLYERVRSQLPYEGIRVESDQPLTIADVPTAALGPSCGLPSPTLERARHSPYWRRIYRVLHEYDPERAPEQTWASLLWHLRGKLNIRPCWSVALVSALQNTDITCIRFEELRGEIEPSYTDERQRVCWQQLAPQVEALSERILHRRFFGPLS